MSKICERMHAETEDITKIILQAAEKARAETSSEPEPGLTGKIKWPIECTVGPGLEGAIACSTKIGYVNGAKGWLIYQGYDIFDLCAHSTFEEVSYLLLHGHLPNKEQLDEFCAKLRSFLHIPHTLRTVMNLPLEQLNPMAALRFGANLMRQRLTWRDNESARPSPESAIYTDEDSIPMETKPMGEEHAIYEFRKKKRQRPKDARKNADDASDIESCMHLISGMSSLTAAIKRIREDRLPIEPDPTLSHAGNLLYMMSGKRPSPEEERLMDVSLILHADHGMNASTFAALVVASTMSDIYFSVGAGIAALNGPLHGGANEQVIKLLDEIGSPKNVDAWFDKAASEKRRVMGFGHRVYKAYDPRARILGPLADYVTSKSGSKRAKTLLSTAKKLEKKVATTLGKEKKIFPNVDYYSGLVYESMGIPQDIFTPLFAVSRVSGWTARILEYIAYNRIFRPRALYVGEFDKKYVALNKR